jgi:hypothetical protein
MIVEKRLKGPCHASRSIALLVAQGSHLPHGYLPAPPYAAAAIAAPNAAIWGDRA